MKESNKKYFDDYNEAVNFLKEKVKKETLAEVALKIWMNNQDEWIYS